MSPSVATRIDRGTNWKLLLPLNFQKTTPVFGHRYLCASTPRLVCGYPFLVFWTHTGFVNFRRAPQFNHGLGVSLIRSQT